MADRGMKIAKEGRHIDEADRYMRQHTKYPVLKLFASAEGTLSTTSGGGGATVEVTHNLGYKPRVFVSGQWIAAGASVVGSKFAYWNRKIYQGVQQSDFYYYYADTTKLYIVVSLSSLTDAIDDFDFDYMYHIFYDEDELA